MLQCMKCAIQHNLLFQEPAPSSIVEVEFDNDGSDSEDGKSNSKEGWDDFLLEDEDGTMTTGMMNTEVDSD